MQNFAKHVRDLSREVQGRREAEAGAGDRSGSGEQERRGAFDLVGRGLQAVAEQWRRS